VTVTLFLEIGSLSPYFKYRRAASDHDRIQLFLSSRDVFEISRLQHLTIVFDHLCDIDGIMTTVLRSIVIDVTGVFIFVRYVPQPGAMCEILTGTRVDPDLAILNVAGDLGTMQLPPIDLVGRS